MRWHLALPLVALAALTSVLQVREIRRCIASSAPERSPLLDGPAPTLALGDRSGSSISLASLKGRTVVVSFWASWCAPCRAEMPEIVAALARWNEEHPSDAVVYLAVNSGEDPREVTAVLDDPRFKAVVFVFDRDGTAAREWGVSALPTLFLVDPAGTVRWATTGYAPGLPWTLQRTLARIAGSQGGPR
ncbi:MAG: TlpA family protein disulfide reductase [Acidobacteria bacterium]|nr:TlpA family protein disulfide reductase [Acidobacteriota bacterium]